MKTKLFLIGAFAFLSANTIMAQDVTTVNAKSSDISDNLDLRAVASIFGESANLEDFERRLNDPKEQISNLDLNNDGNVDYLRVIETVDNGTHVVVIQSVLDRDVFQDVATIEVERDSNNQVQVQVVGDVYMYGPNYIYEPVYVNPPVIYTSFWIGSYHPYHSPYYYNYYPSYYYTWNPYPIYRYRRNVNVYINVNNHYNYVTTRRSQRAVAIYSGRRANGYEVRNPNRSFTQRNANVTNRHDLDIRRGTVANGGRSVRNNNGSTRTLNNGATPSRTGATRPLNNTNGSVRNNTGINPVRNNGAVRSNASMPVRSDNTATPVRNTPSPTVRNNTAPMQSGNVSTPVRSQSSSGTISQPTRTVRTETATPVRSQSAAPRVQSAPVQQSQPRTAAPAPSRQVQSNSPARGNSEGGSRR